ncbi:hypothetical protein BBP00_00006276 [Phytophthora kernoviae]|uniref:dCTP pyrophosphatase 1 n=1 Tax=Phytophthora kernoviae TaxID=325452 RepID=A0A3F2RLH4_9STRA|nr:hypothetical protein BBP00_00006276 [Phytophthora kernoviae]
MDLKTLEEMKSADGAGADGLDTAVTPNTEPPLFEEFYGDWTSFDAAVARATAAYHPIRKRSSLTFEVYNRTVSKGRHDRKNIAEFLSKTFKCTHGIKFRSRGSGKRLRHKLRDIGCPFHLYASAIEYGATYRVKVRTHDKHNHPIGPDSMKAMSGILHESDYELAAGNGTEVTAAGTEETVEALQTQSTTTTSTHMHDVEHVVSTASHDSSTAAAAAVYAQQIQAHAEAQARAQAEAQTQAYQYAQTQALLKAQAQAMLQSPQQLQHGHGQSQSQSVDAADMLSSSNGETLLDGAMDTPMGDPAKFEETMTLESLRKRIADFADERDWNEFHTPRNLLLALTGEVGELCEIFQWKGECKTVTDWSAKDKEHLGEELSDVLIYLVRLADKCDVDLPAALNDKIIKNGRKYPADLVRVRTQVFGANSFNVDCPKDRLFLKRIVWMNEKSYGISRLAFVQLIHIVLA